MTFLYKRRKSSQGLRKGLGKNFQIEDRTEIPSPQPGVENEPVGASKRIASPEECKRDLETDLAACGGFISHISKGDLRNVQKLLELEGYILRVLEGIRPFLNNGRPINRLPQSVLTTIFSFAAAPLTHNSTSSTVRSITSFTRVCRHWRNTILHRPELWSDVHIKGQRPELVARQLTLCRGEPLRVYLHLPHWVFLPEERTLLQNLTGAMSLVTNRRDKVRSLVVRIAGCPAFHEYFDIDFPNLRELVWDDLCVDNSPSHDPTPPGQPKHRIPNLRYLSVRRSLGWPIKFASGLTRFKLEGPMIVPVAGFADFFRQNQTLERLELINVCIPFTIPRIQPIVMNRLATLLTHNVESGHILSHIVVPRIQTLELAPLQPPREWLPTVWSSLQLPSNVHMISLHYNHAIGTGSSMEISIVGINETRTQSFNLIERTAGARFTTMFGALAELSLDSVTCLYFNGDQGREPQTWPLPSPNGAVLESLPRLTSIHVCWTCVVEDIIRCLTDSPRTCPELRILRVKITSDTCDKVFSSVLALAKRRHSAKKSLRSVECIVGEARVKGGFLLDRQSDSFPSPEATQERWNSFILSSKLQKYLRRVDRADVLDIDMMYTEEVVKISRARRARISIIPD